eukprot:PITA_33234
MPLHRQMTMQSFEKLAMDFVGPIKPQGRIGAHYIFTATEYLTRWVEAQPIKDCTAAKFLFENVMTQFGYPKILMSDHETHFLNKTISALTEEFQIQKQCEKAWHNHHIKLCTFKVNDLVLLYDSKFEKFPRKFKMHWLGSYVVKEFTEGKGEIQLVNLREPFLGKVNGSRLKPYTGGPAI